MHKVKKYGKTKENNEEGETIKLKEKNKDRTMPNRKIGIGLSFRVLGKYCKKVKII